MLESPENVSPVLSKYTKRKVKEVTVVVGMTEELKRKLAKIAREQYHDVSLAHAVRILIEEKSERING